MRYLGRLRAEHDTAAQAAASKRSTIRAKMMGDGRIGGVEAAIEGGLSSPRTRPTARAARDDWGLAATIGRAPTTTFNLPPDGDSLSSPVSAVTKETEEDWEDDSVEESDGSATSGDSQDQQTRRRPSRRDPHPAQVVDSHPLESLVIDPLREVEPEEHRAAEGWFSRWRLKDRTRY